MRNEPMDAGGGRGHATHIAVTAQMLPVPNATVPYWRTQLHPVDQIRSTGKLPAECDVAIIGAGMSGVATAYHLYEQAGQAPPSIVLLEARQVCSGATGRNGGHAKIQTATLQKVVGHYGPGAAAEIAAFVNDQIHALKDTVDAEDLDCEFELRRSYDVFIDAQEAEDVKARFRASVKEGHGWTRDITLIDERYAEQVTAIEGARVALSVPACSFWPYKFVSQLLARLVDRSSINVQSNTPVTNVTMDESGRSTLHTPRGTLRARKVVFATNAYTSGICSTYADTVVPYKGINTHITPRAGPVSPHLSNTYNINYQPGHTDYLNPRPDGGIVVGGGQWRYSHDRDVWYGTWDDSTLLPSAQSHFEGIMQRHFNGWENSDAKLDGIWTGVQGQTPDGYPHVGEVPGMEGRHYVLAGFNGGGMATVFLSARGVAQMIAGGATYEETSLPMLMKTTRARIGGT